MGEEGKAEERRSGQEVKQELKADSVEEHCLPARSRVLA